MESGGKEVALPTDGAGQAISEGIRIGEMRAEELEIPELIVGKRATNQLV